jgi:thioredoxin 1
MGADPTPSGPADGTPITIADESTLEAVLDADGLVLLEFHADWCAACGLVRPALGQLHDEYPFTLSRVDIDTELGESVADRYDVSGVPTVVVFSDGERVATRRGVRQKGEFRALLERHLD